ncbi:small secreted protein [Crepidotus variabilis]|uniref:NADH dehydrogenase [ubiquinone] 1 alpha subcomplex subunit 1 n=1 Tax=Crepidotus variabilis TaxID=179855 RepID=A0A9P6EF62_9AGAR|nr:small secreted protein [Crepidotus variabilis]
MPVPWEALIPFGLLTAMFGAAGTLMNVSQRAQNDGKAPRYKLDSWEESMMERDRRLTGSKRGQSTNPLAPKEFSLNSVWQTENL